jgi:hypothetical protein
MLDPISSFIKRTHQTFTSLLLVVTLTLTAQAQDYGPKPHTVRLKRGQVLVFSLLNAVDSGQAQKGDDVSLTLMRPLMVDGGTVLPAGWIAHTKINKVVRAGKNCKSGKIEWKLSRLDAPGKEKVRLQLIPEYLAKHDGQLVDWVALDSPWSSPDPINKWPVLIIFAPLLVIAAVEALSEKDCEGGPGREASVAAGTEFYFAVTKDADVVTYQVTPGNVTLEQVSQ